MSRPHPSGLNRATRRALDKGARCIERTTKIPAGVRTALRTQAPGRLKRLAGEHGMTITAGGYLTPNRPSAGADSPPDLAIGEAA